MRDESLEDAQHAIRHTLHEWKQAIAAGDPEALSRLVTEDAEFWSHETPPLEGRDAVSTAFATLFERYSVEQRFECDELVIAGSWAFLRGTEVNRLVPKEGGSSLEIRQRAFSVLHRSDDGRWLFARGMTHRPPPPEDRN